MRVLVVKLGAIGDVVMSLTIIEALREISPSMHLTWLVGRGARPVLDLVLGIDRVVEVRDDRLLVGSLARRVTEVASVWRDLLGQSFDLVITGHSDWRYSLLTLPVKAGRRRRFSRAGRSGPIAGRYHGSEYARLVTGQDGPGAVHYPLPVVRADLPEVPFIIPAAQSLVVLAPGGARNVLRNDHWRRWPAEHYASIAKSQVELGRCVVLVGGPQDADVRSHFAGIGVVDLVGRTTLPQLAAVLRASRVVVTHDSLALHLARLLRTPTIALFGPTSPYEKVSPDMWGTGNGLNGIVHWGGSHLPCRPCYDGLNYHVPCKRNQCMWDISPVAVNLSIDRILRRVQGGNEVSDRAGDYGAQQRAGAILE